MSLSTKLVNSVGGLFNKLKEPVVLKDTSSAENRINQLKSLLEQCSDDNIKKEIENDIRITEIGCTGENAVLFELKNSHMPMYILRDLYIEHDGLSAQIDFLVVTRKANFIIECKNLYGNITVDENGNFSRKVMYGKYYRTEGIYSPATQNKRHIELIKAKRALLKSGLKKTMFLKCFDTFNRSVIVLAAPKSTIDVSKAPAEIKNIVVRADGLIAYLKKMNDAMDELESGDEEMKKFAESFLELCTEPKTDYTEKYRLNLSENTVREHKAGAAEQDGLYAALKQYRLDKSREENVKAYFIFNNAEMDEIIESMPESTEELLKIHGFGQKKTEKYGGDIIEILNRFR